MQTKKIFLASSSELTEDRKEFELFINRKNKAWIDKGIFLKLEIWEDFPDTVSQTRLQDEYNKAVRESDIFVMLFFTKVGQYTEEEFNAAFGQFKATNKPFILTYFKNADISLDDRNEEHLASLLAFKKRLRDLGHFPAPYKNTDALKLHFNQQLDKLAENGFIEFNPNKGGAAPTGGTVYQATLTGNGAIAQGGGTAIGAGGVSVGGNNTGMINTGTQTNQAKESGSGAVAQDSGDALGKASVKVGGSNTGSINTGLQFIKNYQFSSETRLSAEAIAQRVARYLRWLQDRTKSIELRGIERAGHSPRVILPLETAYVPLRARSIARPGDIQAGMRGKRQSPHNGIEPQDHATPGEYEKEIALNQALGLDDHLVIIGGPGSGKTTVLLHMAWALATSLLAGRSEPAVSRLGLTNDPRTFPLPVFVTLASFARYRRGLPAGTDAREQTLAHFISYHQIKRQAGFDLPEDFFVQLLENGNDVLLLLDGMDEVANENERAEVRQSIEDMVSGRRNMRVVVTCRTVAYRNGRTALGADFREVTVQTLGHKQHIEPMVTQAYACICPHDTVLRDDRTRDLLAGIQRLERDRRARLGEDAKALVDSPLMVRLLLIVHLNNRTLPDERASLYDKAINALLQVDYGLEDSDINELSTDWKIFRDMAQHLALHMHQQGPDQGREIDEAALKQALRQEPEFIPYLEQFLSHAHQRASVLEERNGVYRFIHLAFQEFLVARYLREVTGGEGRESILDFLSSRLDDPWWREPILLLAGYMATNAAKAARKFLSTLATTGATSNAQFSASELAGSAVLEWPDSGAELRGECAQRIVQLLNDNGAVTHSVPVLRARAADTLARLGDPRFDPQRHHLPVDDMLGFVPVPADPQFRIGTRKTDAQRVARIIGREVDDYEINDEPTPTPAFYIARYPVTVAQFRAFVESTGFRIGDNNALRDPGSRPVRWVSLNEALAYCDWLNNEVSHSPAFAHSPLAALVREDGWRITLPSELEWEKAARGGQSHAIFPWGDRPDPNRANYGDSGIEDTSVVGCFPANGFGLHDMVGNVWEWTRSPWGKDWEKPAFAYPYDSEDAERENQKAGDEIRRVARGGAWFNPRGLARCAFRFGDLPGYRDFDLGFRVVLRSSHVLPPLLLVMPAGMAARQDIRPDRVPEMQADSLRRICLPRRRKKNSAGHVWSAHKSGGSGRRRCRAHCPGTCCNFSIHEPKRRKIRAAPFQGSCVSCMKGSLFSQVCGKMNVITL